MKMMCAFHFQPLHVQYIHPNQAFYSEILKQGVISIFPIQAILKSKCMTKYLPIVFQFNYVLLNINNYKETSNKWDYFTIFPS
jgi:hypothetical protein